MASVPQGLRDSPSASPLRLPRSRRYQIAHTSAPNSAVQDWPSTSSLRRRACPWPLAYWWGRPQRTVAVLNPFSTASLPAHGARATQDALSGTSPLSQSPRAAACCTWLLCRPRYEGAASTTRASRTSPSAQPVWAAMQASMMDALQRTLQCACIAESYSLAGVPCSQRGDQCLHSHSWSAMCHWDGSIKSRSMLCRPRGGQSHTAVPGHHGPPDH